jgi:hypothetical protein
MRIKYLYIIKLTSIFNRKSSIFQKIKNPITKVQSNANKLKNWNIYGNINIGINYGKRLSADNLLTKYIHRQLRKKDFDKNIKEVKYRQLNNIEDLTKYMEKNITPLEANKFWDFCCNTLASVYYKDNDKNSNILFFSTIDTFIQNNKDKNYYNRSLIESICNINYVYHIYQIFHNNKLIIDEVFYFYNRINYSNLKNGINKNNSFLIENEQNKKIYTLNNKKLEIKEDSLFFSNTIKNKEDRINININNENIFIYKNLVAIINEKDVHFFIIDKYGDIYHWKNHEEFNIENGKFIKVKNFSLENSIFNLKKEDNHNNQKLKTHLEFKELQLLEDLYRNDIQYSSYLTFLYLLTSNQPNEFPKKIVELSELQDFIKFLDNKNRVYEFKRENINKIFYFILGYNSEENYANKGLLPLSFLKSINVNEETIKNYIKEDANLKNNLYDLSNYLDSKNIDPINKSLISIPKTNKLETQNIYINGGMYGLYNIYIISISLSYILNNNIHSEIEQLENKYSPYILEISFGVCFLENCYFCFVNEFLFPSLYEFNKYCDYTLGFGVIITSFPFLVKIFLVYDIYNNILNIKSSLGGTTLLYGNIDNFTNKDFYVEYDNNFYYNNELVF